MRAGGVPVREVEAEGCRLTGGFHLSEDQIAVSTLRAFPGPTSTVGELALRRGIFKGPMFKRVHVEDPSLGEPYVSARDLVMADVRPASFLTRRLGSLLEELRLRPGMILVTRSGMNLGSAIWTREDLAGLIASDDLIRICPDPAAVPPGYLYAFLASRYGRAMIRKQIYGGSIKHVEPQHIEALTVPRFGDDLERRIHELVVEAAQLRTSSSEALRDVGSEFDLLLSREDQSHGSPRIGTAYASRLQARLDAQFHDPVVRAIRRRLEKGRHTTIGSLCPTVILPGIFKRIHVEDPIYGAPYYTGAALYCLEPTAKGILSYKTSLFRDVKLDEGTILVQAFGQDGGITGRAVWVGEHLAGATTTHMLCRLRARDRVTTAFLYGFLQSEAAYRQIQVLTYGGSIPHFDEAGISTVVVPLLESDAEVVRLGTRVLTAVRDRDAALTLDREARALVEHAIEAAN